MNASTNQLVSMLENYLLTPTSDFYLSTILHSPSQGNVDPLNMARVDLGSTTLEGIPISIGIQNMNVRGLSNVQIILLNGGTQPDIQVLGDQVTFHAQLPNNQKGYVRPPDVPAVLEMTGGLDITLAGQVMPPGTISVTVNAVSDITGVFTATEQTAGQLTTAVITFEHVSLTADQTTENINITITLDTVFCPAINQILNQPTYYGDILSQVNTALATPGLLTQLSQAATQAARTALGKIG